MSGFKHRWLVLVLALLMACAGVLPFAANYAPQAHAGVSQAEKFTTSLFGDKILICTGDGFALVSRADLASGKSPVKQHKGFACAICYLNASGLGKLLLLAAVYLGLVSYRRPNGSLSFLYRKAAPRLASSIFSARAPPSFC